MDCLRKLHHVDEMTSKTVNNVKEGDQYRK